jgi:hypothetical protein
MFFYESYVVTSVVDRQLLNADFLTSYFDSDTALNPDGTLKTRPGKKLKNFSF